MRLTQKAKTIEAYCTCEQQNLTIPAMQISERENLDLNP